MAKQKRTEKPARLVPIDYTRDRDVERIVWQLIEIVAANEVRGLAIAVVRKDGSVRTMCSHHSYARFEFVGALEQLKADVLGLVDEQFLKDRDG